MRSCINASQSKQKISRQFGHCKRTPSMRAPHPRQGDPYSYVPGASLVSTTIRDVGSERECVFANDARDCRGAMFEASAAAGSASIVSTEDGISRKTLTGKRWWYDLARCGAETSMSEQVGHVVGRSFTLE